MEKSSVWKSLQTCWIWYHFRFFCSNTFFNELRSMTKSYFLMSFLEHVRFCCITLNGRFCYIIGGLTMGFKMFRNTFLVGWGSLTVLEWIWLNFFFLIVRKRKILRYSGKWLWGIVSLYKKNVCVYLIKNIFYTLFLVHFLLRIFVTK